MSSDGQGQSLFRNPWYVASDIERNTVTVTDYGNDTLTVLNAATGSVLKRRRVDNKGPYGVTTGPSGIIFVCYDDRHQVAELTGDLTEERTFLTVQDGLDEKPYTIAYDKSCGQLITSNSYYGSEGNSVDVWELLHNIMIDPHVPSNCSIL